MARTRRQAVPWATILRELRVARVADVTATMRRVTLIGEQLGEFAVAGGTAPAFRSEGFDDHVKLLVPLEGTDRPPLPVQGPDRLEWGGAGGRPVAKDYTPRRFDAAAGELDLDFVLHEGGFAAGWARRTRPGDPAWIVGPTRSLLLPEGVRTMVLAADETALPAVARLLDEWTGRMELQIVVDVPSPASVQDLPSHDDVTVQWVHGEQAWLDAVRALPWPADPPFCWVAGESSVVRRLRRHLADDRAVPRDLLDPTGYWRR